jgi:hypothetical protein
MIVSWRSITSSSSPQGRPHTGGADAMNAATARSTTGRLWIATIVTLVAVVSTLAGCGGSEPTDPAAVESCLRKTDVTVDKPRDVIAEEAGVSALRLEWPKNEAHVLFERSGKDARASAEAYELFDVQTDQRGSTLIAWTKTPTDEEKALVDGCL